MARDERGMPIAPSTVITDRTAALRDRAVILHELISDLAPSPIVRISDIEAMEGLLKTINALVDQLQREDLPGWREAVEKHQYGA